MALSDRVYDRTIMKFETRRYKSRED